MGWRIPDYLWGNQNATAALLSKELPEGWRWEDDGQSRMLVRKNDQYQ